jgi:hypothetical protein
MAVSTVYVLHGVKTPSSFYSQVHGATPSPQVQAVLQYGSGYPQPLFKGVVGYKPIITFRTSQIATLLAECGLLGVSHAGGNCDVYYRQVTDFGSRDAATATTAMRLRLENAFMYWRTISAGHRTRAMAEVTLCGLFDGTNAPIIPAGDVEIAGTPSAAEFFGLGPVEINTVTLDGVQQMNLDLGTKLIQAGSASELYDTFVGVQEINPKITIRGLATEPWTTYGLVGEELTSLVCFLRKLNNQLAGGLAYVADACEHHVSIGANAGTITLEDTQAGDNGEAMTGLLFDLIAPDTTQDAVQFDTAVAIT